MDKSQEEVKAEILSMGNELLIGRTVNTNATWICQQLAKRGVSVVRVTMFRDVEEEAVEVIKEVLKRKPRYVFITGGLGPTFDDIQLLCVAKATGKTLVKNQEALKLVKNFYEKLGYKMNEAREKMAFLPEGAEVIPNPVGAAPGSKLEINGTIIFSLPGVPSEMKAMMKETILPEIEKEMKERGLELVVFAFYVWNIPESEISSLVSHLVKQYPQINFKTHPKGHEGKPKIDFQIYGFTDDPMKLMELMKEIKMQVEATFPDAKTGVIRRADAEEPMK